jgi:hypothetical protein
MSEIVPFKFNGGLQIETTTGEIVTIGAGTSGGGTDTPNVVDMLPGGGGQALPRITAGQPRDTRFPEGANQLYLIQNYQAVNEQGEKEKVKEFRGPFGTNIAVRVVGYAMNRSLMPKYDPNAPEGENKPLCHSEDFIYPDAQYMGKYSTLCCAVDPRSGKLVGRCPMNQWGAKDSRTNKSAPHPALRTISWPWLSRRRGRTSGR